MKKTNKILLVVGTRPNFIKMQSLIKLFFDSKFHSVLVHAGQHYDYEMSKVFFKDLKIPEPNYFLKPNLKNHITQVSSMMEEFDKVVTKTQPDLIMVPGDVNSSLACALVAGIKNIPLAHIESGLRSFDLKMPEEKNRIIIDKLSQFLFVTEKSGIDNLLAEGHNNKHIQFVGNTMMDSLVMLLPKIKENISLREFDLSDEKYGLVTFHRPSNVDNEIKLKNLIDSLNELSKDIKLIFPIHPRTKNKIQSLGLDIANNIITTKPLPYTKFMSLIYHSKFIITDSGGIQEEASFLGIRCFTFRDNTERPITISNGTNILVGSNSKSAFKKIKLSINNEINKKINLPKWDGKSGKRIFDFVQSNFN
jgi:UDP-N-acetylglucosamine 2-epimerase (non-hydrolysing)